MTTPRQVKLPPSPRRLRSLALTLGLFTWLVAAGFVEAAPSAPSPIDGQPDLFRWTDTCNVYILRDGDAAVLIDFGAGDVLDQLPRLGIRRVEWVLFTHHHREQLQGATRLAGTGARIAAPEAERDLFEHPARFRKLEVNLGDPYTIHGASYIRPPVDSLPLDRGLGTNDVFAWHGFKLQCVGTPGNSPGSLTYVLERNGRRLAFSGDVVLDGARMHTWFDTEWDYGFAAGLRALRASVRRLTDLDASRLLPSHGPTIRHPARTLALYARRLENLERLYLRGYGVEHASVAYQDKVSTPSLVSNVVQVTPHLFKFKRPDFWPNFALILAPNGHALVVDCGLLDETFLDTALAGLKTHYGLKAIDAVVVTHMHGDHFLEAPYLRAKWGTAIWALDRMVPEMEHPERFDYSAPVQAYGKRGPDGERLRGVKVDHAFHAGESFTWEGHRFTVDWMPGQTEFALCLHGRIDGQLVAFTGDNIFGDPDDPTQTGHEAMVAHNSAILEEGYILGAEFLKHLQPDVIVGGHSFVMGHPARFIERYRRWAYAMRDAFRALSSEADYRVWFDPFWVRAEPYRLPIRAGATAEFTLHVRNFESAAQRHRIVVHAPPGWTAEPRVIEGRLAGSARGAHRIHLRAPVDAAPGATLVAFDVTLDRRRYGERFDLIVGVVP